MPTERFNRLPEDKKKAIRDAAIQEFIRMPFEKASINQIILNAGISRGSFYTYFEDKRDVLAYLFEDSAVRLRSFCESCLAQAEGDLWFTLEKLLEYCMEQAGQGDMSRLSRNVMMYQDMERILGGPGECGHEKVANDLLQSLYEKTDLHNFKITGIEQFRLFLEIVMGSMMVALGQYFKQPDRAENIKKVFHEKLELMQQGICN